MRHLPYFLPESDAPAAEPAARARPYFLYVGRLERMKGVKTLIEAFRSYRGADLLIVGDGEQRAELEQLATGLEHVGFLGRVHPAELPRLYSGAIATVVPSVGYEVFGIVLLESFAQRTPAVVHDLGALPEVVAEAGGGLVYGTQAELVAALERLAADTALRGALGSAGHEAWRRLWTEDPHLDAYLATVEELRR